MRNFLYTLIKRMKYLYLRLRNKTRREISKDVWVEIQPDGSEIYSGSWRNFIGIDPAANNSSSFTLITYEISPDEITVVNQDGKKFQPDGVFVSFFADEISFNGKKIYPK